MVDVTRGGSVGRFYRMGTLLPYLNLCQKGEGEREGEGKNVLKSCVMPEDKTG